MTPQIGEVFLMEGEQYFIDEHPLHQYFLQFEHPPYFTPPSPTCWRGYYGKWELKNDQLYLINFRGYVEGFEEVHMDYLFPHQENVAAYWFTGTIQVPQGKVLMWQETLNSSIYEEYILLQFEKGRLMNYKHIESNITLMDDQEIAL